MAVQTVRATINGQTYDLTYNSTSGKYEVTITAPTTTSWGETDHKYGITITAIDDAGNTTVKDRTDGTLGADLQLRVLEKTKPTISLTSPSSGARVTNATPAISFQLRDSGSGINIGTLQLKIDGGTAKGNTAAGMTGTSVSGGYNCTYVPGALAEGAHTVTISITDNDGNVSNLLSSTFTVDTAPPALNIASPEEGLITNNATVTVSGTTNDVTSSPVTIGIKVNGGASIPATVSEGAFSKAITLTEGANTIEITATDSAGLTSKVTRHVELDTAAPVISAVTATPNPVDGGQTFVISVTVTD